MLTVEVKLNGETIGLAVLRNSSALADISDYDCEWAEGAAPDLGIPEANGAFTITGHRRRQTAWTLVAKAAAAILGQMVERMEGRG